MDFLKIASNLRVYLLGLIFICGVNWNLRAQQNTTLTPPLSVHLVHAYPEYQNRGLGEFEVTAYYGTPPYTFHWSNGCSSTINSNLGVGYYVVTVTDAVGDSAVKSYFMDSLFMAIEVLAVAHPIGNQSNGVLALEVSCFGRPDYDDDMVFWTLPPSIQHIQVELTDSNNNYYIAQQDTGHYRWPEQGYELVYAGLPRSVYKVSVNINWWGEQIGYISVDSLVCSLNSSVAISSDCMNTGVGLVNVQLAYNNFQGCPQSNGYTVDPCSLNQDCHERIVYLVDSATGIRYGSRYNSGVLSLSLNNAFQVKAATYKIEVLDTIVFGSNLRNFQPWLWQPNTRPTRNAVVVYTSNYFTVGNDTNCAIVTGKEYVDYNSNCVYDSNYPDRSLKDIQVEFNPGGYATSSKEDGTYTVVIPPGNYTISQSLPSSLIQKCPTPGVSVLNAVVGHLYNIDIADSAVGSIDLEASHYISYTRPGMLVNIELNIENKSNQYTATGLIKFEFDSLLKFISSSTHVQSQNAGLINWSSVTLGPFESWTINLLFRLDSTAQIGDTLISAFVISNAFGEVDTLNNKSVRSDIITGPFDPNELQVSPLGFRSPHYISNAEPIYYTVNFQNTGNDTASNIVVVDTLPLGLDLHSIKIISSSHHVYYRIFPNRIVKFYFDVILLPDSNSNEALSHGFVCFKIRLEPGIPTGTLIENSAAIFFDFNSPIQTNSVFNTVFDCDGYSQPQYSSQLVCIGDSISGLVTPVLDDNLQWKLDGLVVSANPYFDFGALAGGVHVVDMINKNSLCNQYYRDTLIVDDPHPSIVQVGTQLATSTGTSYQWFQGQQPLSGATDSIFNMVHSGTYQAVVVDGFGCSASSNTIFYCAQNGSVQLSGAPFCDGKEIHGLAIPTTESEITWYLDGLQFSLDSSLVVDTLASGIHQFVAVFSDSVCSKADTAVIQVHPNPTSPALYYLTDTLLTTAQGNAQWYFNHQPIPSANQSKFLPTQSGNYSVQITNGFGCVTMSIDTFFCAVRGTINLAKDSVCFGEPLVAGVSNFSGLNYDWFVDSNVVLVNASLYIDSLPGGLHLVSLEMNDSLCAKRDSHTFFVRQPTKPTIYFNAFQVWTDPAFGYIWYRNGVQVSASGAGYILLQNGGGYFYVDVFDSIGCSNRSDTLFISPTGIQEQSNQSKLVLAPVPATDYIELTGQSFNSGDEIMIVDLFGKIISSERITSATDKSKIDVKQLAPAMYIVQVKSRMGSFIGRMVKVR